MAYAIPADIEKRLGRELDESEATIVDTRLGDAELIIRTRVKDLDLKVEGLVIDRALVIMIEADAVLRLIRNPDGYQTESDGNYSYTIDQRVASGRLAILDEEWAMLGVRSGVTVLAPKVNIPWANNWETEGTPESPTRDQSFMSVWWTDE
jgi:hypothetical protein